MAQARIQTSNVHQDVALSNLSIAYAQEEARFIANQVFPEVPVDKRSDKYYIWARDFWHRAVMARKTSGSKTPRAGLGINTATYTCEGFWLGYQLDRDTIANEDATVRSEQAATKWLTYQALLNREIKFAADFFVTGIWTEATLSSTDQWSDFDGSDPIAKAKAAIQAIEKASGAAPNTLVVSGEVFDNGLENHPLLIDRYKYTQKGILTADLIAPLLGVKTLLVARAIKNSAVEKAEATESYTGAYIFGKNALFLNVVPDVGLEQPAAGKTFNWRRGGEKTSMIIERYADDDSDADILRIRDYFDQKQTSSPHGYMYLTAVA